MCLCARGCMDRCHQNQEIKYCETTTAIASVKLSWWPDNERIGLLSKGHPGTDCSYKSTSVAALQSQNEECVLYEPMLSTVSGCPVLFRPLRPSH